MVKEFVNFVLPHGGKRQTLSNKIEKTPNESESPKRASPRGALQRLSMKGEHPEQHNVRGKMEADPKPVHGMVEPDG